jgi:Protein NO VEIN, C-terminal
MVPLTTNKAVEDAAIAWVIQLERAAGREPRDTRYVATSPADIESPPRLIEVKAYGASARGQDVWLEVAQVEAARRSPDFYVYIVENVRQGDPAEFTLKELSGDQLERLLLRAKEHHYFTVPWPTADYDSTPNRQ